MTIPLQDYNIFSLGTASTSQISVFIIVTMYLNLKFWIWMARCHYTSHIFPFGEEMYCLILLSEGRDTTEKIC